jgi:hypothetical protein
MGTSEDQFIHLWHSPNPEVRLRAPLALLTNPHASGLITNDVVLGAFEAL